MQKTLVTSLLALSLISCSTNTGTGALVGGGSGALIGGLAGGWEGAAIGGAAGAILGGLIGNAADQKEKQQQIDNQYPGLSQKQQVIVISKMDLSIPEMQAEIRESLPKGLPLVFISSITQEGLQTLKDALWRVLQEVNPPAPVVPDEPQ